MKKHVREAVINHLISGPTPLNVLVENISIITHSSIQAVYETVRALKKEEVITMYDKNVSLSLIFIQKEKDKLLFAEKIYLANKDIIEKLAHDSSKITFHFKTISELDLFWTNIYTTLTYRVTGGATRYLITPHDFFLYARSETDSFWVTSHITKAIDTRLVITHATTIDKEVIKVRQKNKNTPFQFLFNKNLLNQQSDIYYNILGDYILKAMFDKKINKDLELVINNFKKLPITTEEQDKINTTIHQKGKFTLVIERNSFKATSLRKKLDKYFTF